MGIATEKKTIVTNKFMKDILTRNIGVDRYDRICSEFQLSQDDQVCLETIMSEWKPSLSLPYVLELVKKHESYPHISRVYAALQRMAQELDDARRGESE